MALKLHAGLIPQYDKLRKIGIALLGFFALSAGDLIVVLSTSNPDIVKWRPALVPTLTSITLFVPLLLYFFVWRRIAYLQIASNVVRLQTSKEMLLRTWKKDLHADKAIYFFDLDTVDHYGCRVSSYMYVGHNGNYTALAEYCERSWQEKSQLDNAVKAFIDEDKGEPIALQTASALDWVNFTVHPIKIDDKENMLKQSNSEYQLSGEAK